MIDSCGSVHCHLKTVTQNAYVKDAKCCAITKIFMYKMDKNVIS